MNPPTSGPTVYATLMREAIEEAEAHCTDFLTNSSLRELVAPHTYQQVKGLVRMALQQVYIAGVQHGYTQSAAAFDTAPDDTPNAEVEAQA